MIERFSDWRPRLSAYLVQVARRPFRPGAHDCALFAAGCVEAMTGADLAAVWRGNYRTIADGRQALLAAGHADHISLAAAHFEEIVPSFAQVGDLAVLPGDGEGAALGIFQGGAVYVLKPSGLALVSRLHVERAFSV